MLDPTELPWFTLVPAYGRVYNSKTAIWSDWIDGKDFQIVSVGPDHGRYINTQDAKSAGLVCLLVRYGKRLQKTCLINLIENCID